MPDYTTIVDEIRGILLSNDATRTDRDDSVAREYSRACSEVNGRLAKCQRLLKQGLRAEALHAAKSLPDLVESIENLFYFSLRPDWLERLELYALTLPQSLDDEAFSALQEAFADEAPLQGLLRRHRRLALARAPLQDRIEVLRELAFKDPTSILWPENLLVLESARIEQIRHESVRANSNRDIVALGRLSAELSAAGWSIVIPPNVLSGVRRALQQFRTEDARSELRVIEMELNEAHSAMDYDLGRAARTRWLATVSIAALAPDDPILERAESDLDWVARRDLEDLRAEEYQKAVAVLEGLLNGSATKDELEAAYRAVAQFELGLPAKLQYRFEFCLNEIDRAKSRRHKRILTGSVLGLVVIMGLGVWIVHEQGRDREARLMAKVIADALKEGRLGDAIKVEENARKDNYKLLTRSEIVEPLRLLAQAVADEKHRKVEFDSLMDTAAAAPITKSSPESLTRAREFARSNEDLVRIEQLLSSRGLIFDEQVAKVTKEFLPQYQRILANVSDLREKIAEIEDFGQIEKQLEVLMSSRPKLSKEQTAYAEEVIQINEGIIRISSEISVEVALRRTELVMAEGVVKAVREIAARPESFEEALNALLNDKRLANRSRARQYRQVLSEKEAWLAALSWSSHVRLWGEHPLDISSQEAEERAKLCDKLLAEYPKFADEAMVKLFRDEFQALTSQHEAKVTIERVLANFLFDRVYMIEVDDAAGTKRYYAKAPHKEQLAVCLVGFAASDNKNKVFPEGKVRSAISPQSHQVNAIRKSIQDDPNLSRWDELFINAMKGVAADRKLDPIPKRLLMVQIAQAASEGSTAFREAIRDTLVLLKDPKIPEGMLWMDPDKDSICDPVREDVRQIIASLRWDLVAQKLKSGRADFLKTIQAIPQPVGVLAESKKNDWRCVLPGALPKAGRLQVMVPKGQRSAWQRIGEIKAGKAVLSVTSLDQLVQGRLIFYVPE